jgi:hypothetical protein
VFLARFHYSGSSREFETKIFGAYPLLGVFIISLRFLLKTPSGLGDPWIKTLGLFRGLIL